VDSALRLQVISKGKRRQRRQTQVLDHKTSKLELWKRY